MTVDRGFSAELTTSAYMNVSTVTVFGVLDCNPFFTLPDFHCAYELGLPGLTSVHCFFPPS